MKATNTSKKKGTMYWGANTAFFAATGGQAKELGGKLPPSLYVKRGPVPTFTVGIRLRSYAYFWRQFYKEYTLVYNYCSYARTSPI